MERIDPYYGIVSDKTYESDKLLGGGLQWISGYFDYCLFPTASRSFWLSKTQFQQTEVSSNSCTIHGAIGAACDLLGITLTLDERKEIWKLAISSGASDAWGWYVVDAVNLVKSWIMTNKQKDLTVYRVSLKSPYAIRLLEHGYSLVVGYKGNSKYNQDKNSDGIVDEDALTGSSNYGHCIRISLKDRKIYAIDNYSDTAKYNIYTFKNFRKLVNNKVFFENAYLYSI